MSTVKYVTEGAIAWVTLDRPARLNAISTQLAADLHTVLVQAASDDEVRVIILTGNGRAFCAGDDLKEFDLQTASPEATATHIRAIQQITRDLMSCDKLVVGAVQGYAVGGGFEWMLNCDLVVAATDLVAFFPELEWGQFPTGGITHLLPSLIGHQRAMQMFVLGERQSAQALLDLGLVNWVVEPDELRAKARQVAQEAASKSAFSLSQLKRLVVRGSLPDLDALLDEEEAITIRSFKTQEAHERSANFPTQDS